MQAGDLNIRLMADLAQFQRQMNSAQAMAERTAQGMAGAFSKLGGVLAGAFSITAVVQWTRAIINGLDAMNDLVDATGASIEEISKLDQVARRNGASLDQVGSMLVKFNAQLKEADGKNGASIALQAIGLEAAKLRQMDPAEALRQTAVALASFADDANKARIVQELFGKSVREAAPFLKDLAEAGELQASVTAQQAAEAEKFNKQMALLGSNVTEAARSFVSDLLPALNDTLTTFNKFSANGGVMSGFFKLLVSQFKDARIQATLEEIARLESRLSDTNVTGFNRSNLQKELRDATQQLRELQGEAVKARTALDAAFGRRNAGAGRGDEINPPFALAAPSVIDIAAEQARRKAADEAAIKAAKDRQAELDIQAKRQMANIAAYEKAEQELEEQLQRTLKAELDLAAARGLKAVAAYEAAEQAIDESLAKAKDLVAAINNETAALSMSNQEREIHNALLALEATGLQKGTYAYEEYARQIREAVVNRETVRASIEQTKTIEEEWRRTADQIGQSLTDALMTGGKSAWEYIKGLFRSMVLRPVIQAVVNPLAGGATSLLQGGVTAANIGSVITGSITGSIANAVGMAGSVFGSQALTAFSAGMKGATLAPGLMGPTTAGAGGAMGAGASVAAAIPYVAAALAVLNVAGVFRSKKIVGGGLTGTLGEGDIQSYDLQRRGGTLFSGPDYSMVNQQVSAESRAIQTAYEALRTNAASMAESLGLSGDAVRSFTTQLGTDILHNDLSARGIKLDGLSPEEAGAKVQAALNQANEDLAAFVLGASRTVTETLTESIESWSYGEQGDTFNGFVERVTEVTRTIEATGVSYRREGETNVQTLQRLASSLGTVNPALDVLGLNLYATSLAGADLASQLADAFGGLEAFGQATASYYSEFYSEAERTAKTTEQLTKALGDMGLSLPATRDAYRQLVEAQDLNTEAGRKNFAALVQLSGTFAAITPVLEEVTEAGETVTETLRSAADILRERQGLERELLQLQGDTTALRALDRAALDASNQALFDQITALQDSQAAAAAAAQAAQEAADAERALAAERDRIAQERAGLERQLLQLQGDTNALRALDRAALDESNRALFDQITALQDSQAAASAAAQAQREYAQAVETARANVERARTAVESAEAGVNAVREAGTSAYLSAQDRVAAAQARIAEINAQVANEARDAALRVRELGTSLQQFVTGEFSTPSESFGALLRKALGGDTAAMQGLPEAARAAIDVSRSSARTSAQAAIERARILSSVAEVAAVAAATAVPAGAEEVDPMTAATAELASAQAELADALSVANTIGAPLTRKVEDLLERFTAAQEVLAKAQTDYAAAQQVLADIKLNTGNTVTEVTKLQGLAAKAELEVQLKAVAESNLPDDIKALIADKGKTYTATITAVMDSALTDAQKTLLLEANSTGLRSVILSSAFKNVLTAQEQQALMAVDETVLRTIQAVVSTGTLTNDQKLLLQQQSETVRRTIQTLVDSSALTDEQKRILGLVTGSTSSTLTLSGTLTFDPSNSLQSIFNNISASNAMLARLVLSQVNPATSTVGQKASAYAGLRQMYSDADTRRIVEVQFGPQTNEAWAALKQAAGFATGGVFTNGIVTQPTAFPLGVMGEGGSPEAIMPLGRGADGSLGVQMLGNSTRRDEVLVAEIRALRAEVTELRAEARSTAVATNKTARILDRVTPDGNSLQTVAAA